MNLDQFASRGMKAQTIADISGPLKLTGIRTRTNPRRSDHHEAWLESNKAFRASSTASQSSAARNLAYRFFFKTWKPTNFPDDPSRVTVRSVGSGVWEATYNPTKAVNSSRRHD